jgi:hypothetical protein
MRWKLLLVLVIAATQALADPVDPLQAYRDAIADLDRHSDGLGYDGSAEGRQAQANLWARAIDWARAYLNTHPQATPDQLATAGHNLNIAVQGLRLDEASWVIAFNYGEAGTVFILSRRQSGFQESWQIDSDRSNDKDFPALAGWTVDAANASCQGVYREEVGDVTCGPLYGGLTRLPDDAAGHRRFALDANYGERAGASVGSQFTVWSWDGAQARPLYLKSYVRPIEGMENRFDGHIFHLEARTEFRTAYVTSPEIGRQVDTAVRISAAGVKEFSQAPAVPELDFVDQVLAAYIRHQPVGSLMSSQAAATLEGHGAADVEKPNDFAPLGELVDSAVHHGTAGATACFETEELGTLLFSLERRRGKLFVTRIAALPIKTGADCHAAKP